MSSVFSFTSRPFQDDNNNSNCLSDNIINNVNRDGGGATVDDSSDSELDWVSGGRYRRKQRRFEPKLRKVARKDSNSSSPDFTSAKRGMRKRRADTNSSEENHVYEGSILTSTQSSTDFKGFKELDHGNEKKPVIQDNDNHMRGKSKEISGEEALRLYNLNWPNHKPTTGMYEKYKQKQQLLGGIKSRTQPSSPLRCPVTNVEQQKVVSSSFGSSDSSISSSSDSSPVKLKHKQGLLRRSIPSSIISQKELGGNGTVSTSDPGVELMQNDVVLKTLAALRADEVSCDSSGDDSTNIAGRPAMMAGAITRRSRKGETKRYVKVVISFCMGEEGGGKVRDSQQQYSVKTELGESLRSITDKALHSWGMEPEDVDTYVFKEGTKQIVNSPERSLRELGIGMVEREPHVELWKKGRLHCADMITLWLNVNDATMLEVQIARTTRFGCLKKCFTERFHLKTATAKEDAIKFEFDGENLYENSTPMPDSLDMDDNDEIKVSARDIDMTELQSCKVLIVSS